MGNNEGNFKLFAAIYSASIGEIEIKGHCRSLHTSLSFGLIYG